MIYDMDILIEDAVAANRVANTFYVDALNKRADVRKYVLSRVSAPTIRKWGVGFAPGNGGLIDSLNGSSVSREVSEELGLIKTNENGVSKECFYNRITIPIRNCGKIVAFAGRVFGTQKQAKYINSKTSIIYNKNDTIFGLFENRSHIRKLGYAVVVEGYFDLLTLWDCDIKNVLCIGGLHLTDRHIKNIKRYTDTVYIMTDGDSAGKKSAADLRKKVAQCGMSCQVVSIPDGYDPDTLLRKIGREQFIKYFNDQ